MKNGFLTSEFASQLGPYRLALTVLYMGVSDAETMELVRTAASELTAPAQALVMLGVKAVSILGGVLLGAKGAEATRAYTVGRAQQKIKAMDKAG